MKIYLDTDEIYQDELYEHKLAIILGRGKRLRRMLDKFPTEIDFKKASPGHIARTIGIEKRSSKILNQLEELDKTYNRLTKPNFSNNLSKNHQAEVVMCIDTEYLWSDLDSIQYAIKNGDKWELGIIFTNRRLAPSLSFKEAIDTLLDIIDRFKPDIFVGHNFNCDITVLEKVYGGKIEKLHYYDDTMQMVRRSNISNIIGGASLDNIMVEIFSAQTIGLFNAYNNIELFIKYGLKDAIYPIYAREYFITGKIPFIEDEIEITRFIKPEVSDLIDFNSISLKGDD